MTWSGAGVITDEKPTSGEYDLRQIAREWIKNRGLSKPSSGEAFGTVVDEDEDLEYERQIEEGKKADEAAKAERGACYLGSELVEQYRSPDWFVQRMLAPRTVGAISGQSNVSKSFGVLDLSQHVARGRKWFGLNVDQCSVVYSPSAVKLTLR